MRHVAIGLASTNNQSARPWTIAALCAAALKPRGETMTQTLTGLLVVVLVATVLAIPFCGFGPVIVVSLAIFAAALVCDAATPAK